MSNEIKSTNHNSSSSSSSMIRRRQRQRQTPCSLMNLDDLEIGAAFYERLDHAVRITMACAFSGSTIYFTDQNVMVLGFLAIVVIVVLEPKEETVGACLQTIPIIYRSSLFSCALGIIGSVAIFRPLWNLDNHQLAYNVAFPFVSFAAAFLIVIFQWIPQPANGISAVVAILCFANAPNDLSFTWQLLLTLVFGISTTVVFKLLPLPTSSLLPTLKSSFKVKNRSIFHDDDKTSICSQTPPKRSCCSTMVVRSALAVPKIRMLVDQGRELAAAIIAMLVDLAIAEAKRNNGTPKMESESEDDNEGNQNDDMIVVRRHALASINASIDKLESAIIPKIESLMNDAQVEIKILLVAMRQEAGHLKDWLDLLQTIIPTLRFLQGIVVVNHFEDETRADIAHGMKEDPLHLQEKIDKYLEAPSRALTRALCASILNNDHEDASTCFQNIELAHEQLLSALSDLRFDIFYQPNAANSDAVFSYQKDAAKWGHFARGMSFVHGMSRLVCAVSVRSFEATTTPDTVSNEIGHEKANKACPNRSSPHSPLDWLRDSVQNLFAGVQWNKPFSCKRGDLHYAFNFGVQVGLATLWYAIPVLNSNMNNQGLFVSVTTCFISMGKFGLTFQKSVQRILGTAIAGIFSLFTVATLRLSSSQALNATYPFILLCILLTDRKKPYTLDCAAFTSAILLFQLQPTDTADQLFLAVTFRIATVGIGIIQFIVVEMTFFRDSARTRVEEQSRLYMNILNDAFEAVATFAKSLDASKETENSALEAMRSSIAVCKSSTSNALADLAAAEHEPGPTIDVKSPFIVDNYSRLLGTQSSMNTTLSQLLDCFEAMSQVSENETDKPAYRYEVSMLQAMIETIRDPLNSLSVCNDRKTTDREWLRNMRRFKKFAIKRIGFQSFGRMREHSLSLNAKDKDAMVDQSFVLYWVATTRCLLQLCDAFEKASVCYEDIASSHPCFCAVESLPIPEMLTERSEESDVEQPFGNDGNDTKDE